MPPRCKAWLHFTKIDANSVRCNICQKVIAAKASNTTNFINYLTVHKINLRAESCSVFDRNHPPLSIQVSLWTPQSPSGIIQNLHHWTLIHLRVPRTAQCVWHFNR